MKNKTPLRTYMGNLRKIMYILSVFGGLMLAETWIYPEIFFKDIEVDFLTTMFFVLLGIVAIAGSLVFGIFYLLEILILITVGASVVNISIYLGIPLVSDIALFITMAVLGFLLAKNPEILFPNKEK